MKKFFLPIAMLLLLALFAGCDDTDTTANETKSNNTFDETFNLQGTIFDATTGARLTGTSMRVYMTRGTSNISPNVLRRGTSETTFAGDYAFMNVPLPLSAANVTYRVIAVLDGYQQFEAYISYNAAVPGANNTLDTDYNKIGNIYLFPLGSVASDVNVYVEYSGERIEGATVQLQQVIGSGGAAPANNVPTSLTTNRLLNAVNGTLPALTATTDANGVANFAGSVLTLGGQYVVVVLPMTYESTQLALDTGAAQIIIGTSDNESYVSMEETSPGTAANNGLYIVSASNRDASDILSSGVLTLTFNKAIALVGENAFTALLANQTTAVLTVADTVAATVSTDGLVLTLTPSFSTAVVPYVGGAAGTGSEGTGTADVNLQITYSGGAITLAGDDTDTSLAILVGGDGVLYLDGTSVSQIVLMTGPQND